MAAAGKYEIAPTKPCAFHGAASACDASAFFLEATAMPYRVYWRHHTYNRCSSAAFDLEVSGSKDFGPPETILSPRPDRTRCSGSWVEQTPLLMPEPEET
ncbi:hypothetical protein AKJ16_DCAP16287 [Drosera capensis]